MLWASIPVSYLRAGTAVYIRIRRQTHLLASTPRPQVGLREGAPSQGPYRTIRYHDGH